MKATAQVIVRQKDFAPFGTPGAKSSERTEGLAITGDTTIGEVLDWRNSLVLRHNGEDVLGDIRIVKLAEIGDEEPTSDFDDNETRAHADGKKRRQENE